MRRTGRLGCVLAAASLVLLAGCGDDGAGTGGSITVSAAASLTEPFTRIAEDFMDAHPGVEVRLSFDASSTLAAQLLEGAPVDVFASADEATMARLGDLVGGARTFAGTQLVIVTRPGNPSGIASITDLAGAGVIALCGEAVPCGRYAAEVLERAGVAIPESSITRGQNASATLTAVVEGDAVAGLVYVTDARSAGDGVEIVPIPTDPDIVAAYSIAVLAASEDPGAASAFVDHVLGDEGQRVLSDHGFLPAP